MDEQLLTILKLCLLALLYLFFFRVVRAVWAEIRGPKAVEVAPRQPAKAAREAKKAERKALPVQLAIVEPASLKGRTYPLAEELTVGRAAGCQVTIDDTYASQIHARVFSREGQLFVEDLGSTNGTFLNDRRVEKDAALKVHDALRIGQTTLRYEE